MRTVSIEPTFGSWRGAARGLLEERVPPGDLVWEDGEGSGSLFGGDDPAAGAGGRSRRLRIPRPFLALAETVACHREPERWSLLYQAAFRIAVAGEPSLLGNEIDPLVRRLAALDKAVRRDRHKMKAFVRFRKVGENAGREQFVAWFEPEHRIVESTAPFFAKRFASFDWSILTPERSAHWDGKTLRFTGGVPRSSAPSEDALEEHWRTYYANIFNPARLKLKAMQAEMPKKYWKNLPEAPLIAGLTAGASVRERGMVAAGANTGRAHVSAKLPAGARYDDTDRQRMAPAEALAAAGSMSMRQLREAAACCRACPLFERATGTVFGEGPEDAEIVFVGEQPGDEEDVAGRPFVGPAGRVFDRALAQAGIDRREVYVTNAVKHFKWKPSGGGGRKRRLHDRADRDEIHTCKPWLLAEIFTVKPRTVVTLGNTAGRALLGDGFSATRDRGVVVAPPAGLAERVVATVHPSYLLRQRDRARAELEFAKFVADLETAAAMPAPAPPAVPIDGGGR